LQAFVNAANKKKTVSMEGFREIEEHHRASALYAEAKRAGKFSRAYGYV
jgi:hypothetical protein